MHHSPPGTLTRDNHEVLVQTGTYLASAIDVRQLVVGVHEARPIFVSDIARMEDGADLPTRYVWTGAGPEAARKGITITGEHPAVTLAITKKPGENAVDVANGVVRQMELLRGTVIPEGVNVTITRNYGETANDKAMKLIQKLIFATTAVVALVFLALGRREALIVGVAVLLTLSATLFASWAWGFTLNRVSLFALIFSIGILVDDAIVVVENIHRHRSLSDKSLVRDHPERRGRSGRPHDPGDPDRDRRAAAHGLRHRTDGTVHEPDPHQCLHRDADLPRHRLRGDTLAGPAPPAQPASITGAPRGSIRDSRTASATCSPHSWAGNAVRRVTGPCFIPVS